MRYLLYQNVLVAWGWANHTDHHLVTEWIRRMKISGEAVFLTSSIPELGFIRVSGHRSAGQVPPSEAGRILEAMLGTLGKQHCFLADDRNAAQWPAWCRNAAQTTDAHLLALAHAHNAELATLDQGIPGALVIS